MRDHAISLSRAVVAYHGIPGLRLLPGGLALLLWVAFSLTLSHPLDKWLSLALHIVGWGGAFGANYLYQRWFGRVSRQDSPHTQWKFLAVLVTTVVLVTYAQIADRQPSKVSISAFVFAFTAAFFYLNTERLCWHYLAIAAIFGLLGLLPMFGPYTAAQLFIDPAYIGIATLGLAMVAAALLDHHILTHLFPALPGADSELGFKERPLV